MKTVFLIAQFVIAIGLSCLILLQNSKGGLQTQLGGPDFYRTKRGAEKIVFTLTIITAALFFFVTITNILIAR